jgi:hypothetical protein
MVALGQIELSMVQFQLMVDHLLPELSDHMEALCANSNFLMSPTCVCEYPVCMSVGGGGGGRLRGLWV